jgi:hypothetical protein
MIGDEWERLTVSERALVGIAVLLDGNDAVMYLGFDGTRGALLSGAARELASLDPDVRMPLVGTLVRMAMKDGGDTRGTS